MTEKRRESGPPAEAELSSWEYMFRILVVFQRFHGHCEVPPSSVEGSLGHWVARQHEAAWHGQLPLEQQIRLEQLGVAFGRQEALDASHERGWDYMFSQMLAYKEVHGDCEIPTCYAANPRLGTWVNTQRQLLARGTLRPERLTLLREAGFPFRSKIRQRVMAKRWEEHFRELVEFQRLHGHCDPPAGCLLFSFVQYQRSLRRRGHLSEERIRRLDEVGFTWHGEELARLWEKHFAELVEYRRQHGDRAIPRDLPETKLLSRWLEWQRRYLQRGTLSKDRADRLRALGVEAADPDRLWEMQYARLTEFHRQHGHCVVPGGDNPLRCLFVWARRQVKLRAAGKLTPAQIERLDALGFDWRECRTRTWDEHVACLQEFKNHHGHCRVTKNDDPALQKWLASQRHKYAAGALSSDKRARLESIALEGKQRVTRSWDDNFTRLKQLMESNASFRGLRHRDPALQSWILHQRQRFAAGQLAADQRARLESLGFDWTMGRAAGPPPAPEAAPRSQTSQQAPSEVAP